MWKLERLMQNFTFVSINPPTMLKQSSFFLPEENKQQLRELTTKYCKDRKLKENLTKCVINLIEVAHKEMVTPL